MLLSGRSFTSGTRADGKGFSSAALPLQISAISGSGEVFRWVPVHGDWKRAGYQSGVTPCVAAVNPRHTPEEWSL